MGKITNLFMVVCSVEDMVRSITFLMATSYNPYTIELTLDLTTELTTD